ncbi:unnamed protein product [Spirodela intermedia]|uniref:DNA mismatch repair proteins mutS family domain-containing protein n=1 Tax=Spirodela intermedia TaxID=51605 RepID=A0A7I8KJ18_SPIIN|nr:unnamed protein product [Spirodela intermedia]
MQRQKSILSFFQRPSPENQFKSGASLSGAPVPSSSSALHRAGSQQSGYSADDNTSNEHMLPPVIRGTDTPPEKPPRPLIPSRLPTGGSGDVVARPFASIMHKFVKRVKFEANPMAKRDGIHDDYVNIETMSSDPLNVSTSVEANNKNDGDGDLVSLELEPTTPGPETPAMRRFAPRSKRMQDEVDSVNENQHSLFLESSKRMKLIRESAQNKVADERVSEAAGSKFEWLNPAFIKDANGRRPNDPQYDKKTLYMPPGELAKMSASQKQYWNVKCRYMDVILFFKVGKFYELYELDAEVGHKELDWRITHSGVGKCKQVGISESGIDDAVQKLISRGYKVGRIEQVETANQAKARGSTSVIQRKLVHVFSRSTMTDGCIGPEAVHLLALKEGNNISKNGKTVYGFAFVDCAALRFWVGSMEDDASCSALGTLLMQVSPREVLYENRGLCVDSEKALRKYASTDSRPVQLTPAASSGSLLGASEIHELITSKGYFKGSSLSWSSAVGGERHQDLVICALGVLVDHLSRLMLGDLLRNGDILPYHVYGSCLRMDGQTLVNLEIFCNNVNGGLSGTLYKFLDHCLTAPGRRLLRRWICHPLKDVEEVNDRLNVVEAIATNEGLASQISEGLRKLPDLERLLARVKSSLGSSSTLLLPLVGERVLKERVKSFGHLVKGLRPGVDLLKVLQEKGCQIPSLSKILNCPAMPELHQFLSLFETAIEASFPDYQNHAVKDGDPEAYRTLAELFCERTAEWARVNHALSCADVLRSFAVAAGISGGPMKRPVLLPAGDENRGPVLEIRGLWHPYAVGENGDRPVPNDVYLGGHSGRSAGQNPRTLLLTGPNMGGKSTLLRATCLAAVLAQLGCYVPCDSFLLSIVDVMFTRLGAVDRIMSGESTFYVECAETASILQSASQDSLVLLDELGRGTSTFDGYAIAYAVLRHLLEQVDCRLLFATHYHPLTKEFASHPRVNLQHMAYIFRQDGEKELVFLYKLAAGPCPESYGMQVALTAGIPPEVVNSAAAAAARMKASTTESFRSSEARSTFSTLHEVWLRTLLAVSYGGSGGGDPPDEDASDTLLCLWHELRSFYTSQRPQQEIRVNF